MRVLAARFPDRRRASRVLSRLRHDFHVDPGSVGIAPLGVPGRASNGDTVLAGRFPDEWADLISRLVNEAGGEVVANVPETWTRPRAAAPARQGWLDRHH
jgi:hypothetical protein